MIFKIYVFVMLKYSKYISISHNNKQKLIICLIVEMSCFPLKFALIGFYPVVPTPSSMGVSCEYQRATPTNELLDYYQHFKLIR